MLLMKDLRFYAKQMRMKNERIHLDEIDTIPIARGVSDTFDKATSFPYQLAFLLVSHRRFR